MKAKVKVQGHNVKKLYFQGLNIVCFTCDLVVKGDSVEVKGHWVKVKCHMGQGQIRFLQIISYCVTVSCSNAMLLLHDASCLGVKK